MRRFISILRVMPRLLLMFCIFGVGNFMASLRGKAAMTIRVGDVQYGQISQFAPARQGQGIAISPNGKYIAVIGLFGHNILVYRPDGTLVRDIPRSDTYPAPEIFFRNDHEIVAPAGDAAGNEAMLEIWDVEHESASRVIKGSYPGKGDVYNRAKNYAVAGDHVVVYSNGADGDQITLVDLATTTSRCINLSEMLGTKTRIQKTAISPDGVFLGIVDMSRRLLLIDFDNTQLLWKSKIYLSSTTIGAVLFSPDGKQIVTIKGADHSVSDEEWIAEERKEGVKIWNARNGDLIRTISTDNLNVNQASWSRDDRLITTIQPTGQSFFVISVEQDGKNSPVRKIDMRDARSVMFAANVDLLAVLTGNKVLIYQKK